MNNRGIAPMMVLLIFLAIATIGVLVATGNINLASVVGTPTYPGLIQLPVFATIQCVQSGQAATISSQTNSDLNIPQGGYWLSDFLPTNTNAWNVVLNDHAILNNNFEVYLCTARNFASCYSHQNIQNTQNGVILPQVSSNNYIWVQAQFLTPISRSGQSGGTATVTYNPYILQRTDVLKGGTTFFPNNIGCNIPNSDPAVANAVLSAFGIKTNVQAYSTNSMQPGQAFNYITGTVTSITAGNTVTYNGQQAYAVHQNGNGAAVVYPIGQITTNSQTYNVVDLQGPSLGNVACIPGDALPNGQTCNDNFQWTQLQGSQCSILNPCGGSGWVPNLQNPTQVLSYQCIQGSCVQQSKTVDCTLNSQCATNQVCSQATYSCVDASTQGNGLVRGVDYLNPPINWFKVILVALVLIVLIFFGFKYGILQRLGKFLFIFALANPIFWIVAIVLLVIFYFLSKSWIGWLLGI